MTNPIRMKKIIRWSIITVLLAILAGAFILLGPAGSRSGRHFLHVPTSHADKGTVMDSIRSNSLLGHPSLFNLLANTFGIWDKLRPGRYEVSGNSLLGFLRDLRNGRQAPVKMVITKLRTKEDLARVAARLFECDSAAMMTLLNDEKALAPLGLDTNTAMTARRAAVMGSICCSSACKARLPCAFMRASTSARTSGGMAGISSMPSSRAFR